MSNKTTYDIKAFNKSLTKLGEDTAEAANRALSRTVAMQADSTTTSFDEVEVVPYATTDNGTIVLSIAGTDPVMLNQCLNIKASEAAEMLKQSFTDNMKEVIR